MSSNVEIDPQIVETDDMKSVEADWNSMLDRITKILCENKVASPEKSKEIVKYLGKRIKHMDNASPHLILTDGSYSARNEEMGTEIAVYIKEAYVQGKEKILDKILVDVYNFSVDSGLHGNSLQMGVEKRPVGFKKRFLRRSLAVYRMKYFV